MSVPRIPKSASIPLLLALANTGHAQEPTLPELLAHQPLRVALHSLAAEHPTRIQLLNVGASRAGRAIDALRFAPGERTGSQPAILVVANLEGPQVHTSTLALELARRLASAEGQDDLAAMLAKTTVYLIPRANPDGAEARFETPLMEQPATGAGVDNDRDGRRGEDGPSDVDGDGVITQMRVEDPAGTWIKDPADARALITADPEHGELGRYKLLVEGRDRDGDGEVGEDPPHDARVNENFPQDWREHTPSAGLFPTDEPEARSLAEFVLHHKDIGLVLVLGAADNLAEPPPAVSDDAPSKNRIPPSGTLKSDAVLLKELARRLDEAGLAPAPGTAPGAGSFQAWCEAQRGLPTLSLRPWRPPLDEAAQGDAAQEESAGPDSPTKAQAVRKKPSKKDKDAADDKPSEAVRALAWIDRSGASKRFLPWTSFDHPELGPLEIGGLAPYALIEPPAEELPALVAGLAAALPVMAAALPRVTVSSFTAHDLGGDIYELEAAVANNALLPLRSAAALRARTPRPLSLHLNLPAGGDLLAGEAIQSIKNLAGSGGRQELRWLVRHPDPTAISIVVQGDHVGQAQAQPEITQ